VLACTALLIVGQAAARLLLAAGSARCRAT
jgi:hypothetical protein